MPANRPIVIAAGDGHGAGLRDVAYLEGSLMARTGEVEADWVSGL